MFPLCRSPLRSARLSGPPWSDPGPVDPENVDLGKPNDELKCASGDVRLEIAEIDDGGTQFGS